MKPLDPLSPEEFRSLSHPERLAYLEELSKEFKTELKKIGERSPKNLARAVELLARHVLTIAQNQHKADTSADRAKLREALKDIGWELCHAGEKNLDGAIDEAFRKLVNPRRTNA